jgi:uncharacterized protein (DUF58 family)
VFNRRPRDHWSRLYKMNYLDPKILARITPLGLRAQKVVEGSISGLHRSPLHGVSVEFADYREYAPGDDLKRIDWRAYARSNKFQIKRYEEESNLRATIVLDASASMRYVHSKADGSMTKFDYAATIAASMAALLIRQRDAVGLAVFDEQERSWLRPAATSSQLIKICDTLEKTKPDRKTELSVVMKKVAGQIKARGLIIIVSDLLTDLDSFYDALGQLQHQGNEILIFQILDSDEIELPFKNSVLFRDIEGGKTAEELFAEPWAFRKAYKQAMETFIGEVRSRCHYAGITHLMLTTDTDLSMALSHYLHGREQGMIGHHAKTLNDE